jgi:hypothetical protein
MSYDHPRDISIWCDTNEERVLQSIDTMLDKLNLKDDTTKELLVDATKILKEIEQLKQEAEIKLQ